MLFWGVVDARSKWHATRVLEDDFRSCLDQLIDLGEAAFQIADFSFALLQGANLPGAHLKGCCLYGAIILNIELRDADLSGFDLR